MFSRRAESHQADSKAPATKGPVIKQATEEVDALIVILEPYLEGGHPRSLSVDEAAAARGVLEPAIERTLALADKVNKMRTKAMEPDPELQVRPKTETDLICVHTTLHETPEPAKLYSAYKTLV